MSGLDLYLPAWVPVAMLLSAALCGLALGALFDTLYLLRFVFRSRSGCGEGCAARKGSVGRAIFLFVSDLLFALVSAVALLLLCYYTSDGRLRSPTVIGSIIGFLLWRKTVGRLWRYLGEHFICLAERMILALLRWLVTPVSIALRCLRALLACLWEHTGAKLGRAVQDRYTERRIHHLETEAALGFPETASRQNRKDVPHG